MQQSLCTLPIKDWHTSPDAAIRAQALDQIEQGGLLYLPQLPFILTQEEQSFLRPDCVEPGKKDVKFSLSTQKLWGIEKTEPQPLVLKDMLQRYAQTMQQFMGALLPSYAPFLITGNTSFRPVEAQARRQSPRHDDRFVHVDAFPSRPMNGWRILRIFTNIHPDGRERVWQTGEPFIDVANRFLPGIPAPLPGSAALLRFLKITKDIRSPYDHYMLQLHDRMKLDASYQRDVAKTTIPFPAGATWIVYSDQVSHAVLSGQHAMEQTFLLPIKAMANPATSPLRMLEALKGTRLSKDA